MSSRPGPLLALALASLAACGARTDLSVPERDGAPVDAVSVDAVVVATPDATPDVAPVDAPGQPCGCPGTATFRRCLLPRMCCPVTRTCEDPARFNCSGSTPPACR
ncbi:MAG: hypothetical protein U0326_30005 [Polyangiales bacterium]